MTYMVPMMGLSVVLPEDEEGGTWRWYTNQGDDVGRDVERVRPPPKPNEGQSWGYHSIAQPTTT